MANLHRISGHPRAWIAGGTALAVIVVGIVVWRVGGLGGSQPARADNAPGANGGATSTTAPPPPLTLTGVTPADSATGVSGTSTIQVSFSSRLAPRSPDPTLSPAVTGTWQRRDPATLVFTPSVPFVPSSKVTVDIPGGPTGIQAADGATLGSSAVDHFQVEAGSELRVQQLLALLDYLPLAWTPGPAPAAAASAPTTSGPTTSVATTSVPTTSVATTSVPTTSVPTTSVPTTSGPTTSGPTTSVPGARTAGAARASAAGAGAPASSSPVTTPATTTTTNGAAQGPAGSPAPTDAAGQGLAAFSPPAGTFAWRQTGWPASLTSIWAPGTDNLIAKGAVMAFEADHGLATDGIAGPAVWQAMFKALAANEVNTGGYNYAVGSKAPPENLTIWHNGAQIFHSAANTGISSAPTVDGTFPVYERLRSQVMRGTNPNGSSYADPVQYVAYFNGGDAVHYIPRANYGTPASLGCIELPLAAAAQAWPYLSYGTLVTVTG